jgi:hypothetical protein
MDSAGLLRLTHARPVRLGAAAAAGLGLVLALTGAAVTPAPSSRITSFPAVLTSVSADSPTDAWAFGTGRAAVGAVALHWNGAGWARVSLPDPVGTEIRGVAALSRHDAWAVGADVNGLILHWNGTRWEQAPGSDKPAVRNGFPFSVSAVSRSDVWAVGFASGSGSGLQTLAVHWNGTTWTRVPTPSPRSAASPELVSVSADSPSDAWAVGTYSPGKTVQSLALHWNGTSWTRVPIPVPGTGTINELSGVTAESPTDAWAVGTYFTSTGQRAEVLHWDGASWKLAAIPNPGSNSTLSAVGGSSSSDVWAVGSNLQGNLMMHWNGASWTRTASPDPKNAAMLQAVSTVSGSHAWAAGCVCPQGKTNRDRTLLLRWNGTSWARS